MKRCVLCLVKRGSIVNLLLSYLRLKKAELIYRMPGNSCIEPRCDLNPCELQTWHSQYRYDKCLLNFKNRMLHLSTHIIILRLHPNNLLTLSSVKTLIVKVQILKVEIFMMSRYCDITYSYTYILLSCYFWQVSVRFPERIFAYAYTPKVKKNRELIQQFWDYFTKLSIKIFFFL